MCLRMESVHKRSRTLRIGRITSIFIWTWLLNDCRDNLDVTGGVGNVRRLVMVPTALECTVATDTALAKWIPIRSYVLYFEFLEKLTVLCARKKSRIKTKILRVSDTARSEDRTVWKRKHLNGINHAKSGNTRDFSQKSRRKEVACDTDEKMAVHCDESWTNTARGVQWESRNYIQCILLVFNITISNGWIN
jgi:hypothetical protein